MRAYRIKGVIITPNNYNKKHATVEVGHGALGGGGGPNRFPKDKGYMYKLPRSNPPAITKKSLGHYGNRSCWHLADYFPVKVFPTL